MRILIDDGSFLYEQKVLVNQKRIKCANTCYSCSITHNNCEVLGKNLIENEWAMIGDCGVSFYLIGNDQHHHACYFTKNEQVFIVQSPNDQSIRSSICISDFNASLIFVWEKIKCCWMVKMVSQERVYFNRVRVYGEEINASHGEIIIGNTHIYFDGDCVRVDSNDAIDSFLDKVQLNRDVKITWNHKAQQKVDNLNRELLLEEKIEFPKKDASGEVRYLTSAFISIVVSIATLLYRGIDVVGMLSMIGGVAMFVISVALIIYTQVKKNRVRAEIEAKNKDIERRNEKKMTQYQRCIYLHIEQLYQTLPFFYRNGELMVDYLYSKEVSKFSLLLGKKDVDIEKCLLKQESVNPNEILLSIDLLENHVHIVGEKELQISYIQQLVCEWSYFYGGKSLAAFVVGEQEDLLRFENVLFAPIFHYSTLLAKERVLVNVQQVENNPLEFIEEVKNRRKQLDVCQMVVFIFSPLENFWLLANGQAEDKITYILVTPFHQRVPLTNLVAIFLESEKTLRYKDWRIMRPQKLEDDECERLSYKMGKFESENVGGSLSFLEVYQLESFSMKVIVENWCRNRMNRSLEVVIGQGSMGEMVRINLHEKADGPHMLIAGTTGSGKSELLQTFLLTTAIKYSPEEVNFLFVDYKGGGMARKFSHLPHHVGTMTNLTISTAQRALLLLKNEVLRRQRILSKFSCSHIHELHLNNSVEKFPALYLVVDEFAELKEQLPVFLDEIISIARIGRSLGIHLILSTQRPTGVISEQIQSNCRLKICMKVASTSDSVEVIKSKDAAYLVKRGAAIVCLGEKERYVRMQTFWTGEQVQRKANENVVVTFDGECIEDNGEKRSPTIFSKVVLLLENCETNYLRKSLFTNPLKSHRIALDEIKRNYLEIYVGKKDDLTKLAKTDYYLPLQSMFYIGDDRYGNWASLTVTLQQLKRNNIQVEIVDEETLEHSKEIIQYKLDEMLVVVQENEENKTNVRCRKVIVVKDFSQIISSYKNDYFVSWLSRFHQRASEVGIHFWFHSETLQSIPQLLIRKVVAKVFFYNQQIADTRQFGIQMQPFYERLYNRCIIDDGEIQSIVQYHELEGGENNRGNR